MTAIAEDQSRVSLPLFAAALVVTLSGVLTVTEHVADPVFSQEAVTLTLAGFAFSMGCRALKINARFAEWLCIGVIALAVGGTLTGRVDWGALLPMDALRNDARVTVVLCWGAVLLSWVLLHDSTLLFTPVLALAEIGLTASFDLNSYVEEDFVALILGTVFLLIHFQSVRLRQIAAPSMRRPASALSWHLALAALCGLGVIALGVVLITPVEALTHDLSLAGAIRRLTNSGVVPPPGVAPTRFSDTRNFNIGTGAGWSASTQILMHVTSSDGQPHLWRGRTYDHYNGAGWNSLLMGQTSLTRLPVAGAGAFTYAIQAPVMPGRPVVSATFQVLGDTDTFYYATTPRRLTLPADVTALPVFGEDNSLTLIQRASLDHLQYTVQSLVAPDPMDPMVQAHLLHAGTNYPAAIRAIYLGNMSDGSPSGLDPQALTYFHHAVAQALSRLPANQRTPIAKVLAIREWVSQRCTYSLAVGPLTPYQDHVFQFLTQTRKGYCDMFASSMAVLCRVAGLPARVATGFAPGVPDSTGYNLRAMDKHAWTEVYFPGTGWLDFDPTMGTRTDGTVPNSQTVTHWRWQSALRHLGRLPLALGSVILLLLLYVAKIEWLDKHWQARTGTLSQSQDSAGVWQRYTRLTGLLSRLNLPRRLAETPDEYAARARAYLTVQGMTSTDMAAVELLTAQLIAARYAGTASADDTQAAESLRIFTAAAWRLRWRQLRRGLMGLRHDTKQWN